MVKPVYLDWNASAPLRPEARAATVAALDVVGNPSSVHSHGRAARAIVEKARRQVSDALGAAGADIIFTSGASEAAALALAGRDLQCSAVEHDAVQAWCQADLPVDQNGRVDVHSPGKSTLQLANSETGVIQDLPTGLAVTDATQAFGKIPFAFDWLGCDMALVSAHKLGGPRGVGALVVRQGLDVQARIQGGGQEMRRRSGTENVAGIAGFGAAAQAAAQDLADGHWEQAARLRDLMEETLLDQAPETQIFCQTVNRLPNTSYFSTPGWKGETQVMALDLAGYSVSAGSACSSGKARASRVLQAMGFGANVAGGAIRVSIGIGTTETQVLDFVAAWQNARNRFTEQAGSSRERNIMVKAGS